MSIILPIRKPMRFVSFLGVIAVAGLAVFALWGARHQSIGIFSAMVAMVVLIGGAMVWALLRVATSRIEIADDEVVLRYAIYPTVRVPRPLIDAVETVGSGGMFSPGVGLSRGKRHLPVLLMDGGARIPVPMMTRIRSSAAERDSQMLREALAHRD